MVANLPVQRSRSPIEIRVKADFKTYWDAAEKSRLADPVVQRELIVSAHKYAMCFSFLAGSMTSLSPHKRIFLQELTSDTVHLVHALVGGDARGGRFYLRSVIENFWRHHYFRDHIVEYGWLHTREKYYMEMRNLREHCGFLDCFLREVQGLFAELPRLYSELSTKVHSTSSTTLVLRETLSDIRLQEDQVKGISKDLLATLKNCLALCIISEQKIFLGLHVNVQDYLMKALSVAQRNIVQKALPTIEAETELPAEEEDVFRPEIAADLFQAVDDEPRAALVDERKTDGGMPIEQGKQ